MFGLFGAWKAALVKKNDINNVSKEALLPLTYSHFRAAFRYFY